MNIEPTTAGTLLSPPPCSEFLEQHEEWDDTKFRHAYLPTYGAPKRFALCGYDGPSTWRNDAAAPPPNVCPICAAILPEYWDGTKWINIPNGAGLLPDPLDKD